MRRICWKLRCSYRLMKQSNERGVALILALLVVSLLVALILEFDAEARRELKEAALFRDSLRATTLSYSGVQAARSVLQHDAKQDFQVGRSFDASTEPWATPITEYKLGGGTLTASIKDERAKLNLNDLANLSDPKTRLARIARLKRLFDLIQVDTRLVDAIADWVDSDDIAEPYGAETVYYRSLRPPYQAANRRLSSLGELHLVRGFTDEIVQRLAKYVTVYPAKGDAWINLNTADPNVIQALDPRITPGMALEVVQRRPFRSIQELDNVANMEPIAKELRLRSAYRVWTDHFSVRISATVNEVTKTAKAVIQRSGLKGRNTLLYFRVE